MSERSSLLHELMRYATLSASSHNSQCWKFHVEENAIRSSGNPSVPRWLGSLLFKLLFRTQHENDKYATHIRSSAGIAIFISEANDKAHWLEAGRCYERFALQAAALRIRNAFINQPVEVSALRSHFANALGIGGHRPDLVVRFGRGPEMPRSLRRPVQAVLV